MEPWGKDSDENSCEYKGYHEWPKNFYKEIGRDGKEYEEKIMKYVFVHSVIFLEPVAFYRRLLQSAFYGQKFFRCCFLWSFLSILT